MSLRDCFSVKGSSILESVIALTIISICLYVAVLVFATVFSSNTSAKFYGNQQRANELFYLLQVRGDSVYESENVVIEAEMIKPGLKKVTVVYKDTLGPEVEKTYYLNAEY